VILVPDVCAGVSDLLCHADLITQPWGCTDYDGEWPRADCPGGHFHAGVDLGYSDGGNAHLGAPVFSPRDGVVVALGPWQPGVANSQYLGPYAPVIETDLEGVYVELGHVQAVYVAVGERVMAGQHVADLGSLGASSAGHLHLEVRTDGPYQGPPWTIVLDPTSWLRFR
jgi:murein DD-endopeptidase MepM/ murein hydrolase activator NlpD